MGPSGYFPAAFRKDTGDRLKETLASDPQLVMGHILRGYFMLLLVKRELVARLNKMTAPELRNYLADLQQKLAIMASPVR